MSDAVLCTMASGRSAELLDVSRPSLEAYAAHHGMDYVEAALPEGFARPASWAKVPLLRDLLCEYEHAFWVDADAAFVDLRPNVLDELHPEAVMGMVEHVIAGSHQPNAGIWLLRACPEARRVLDWIWNAVEYVNHPWWETAAVTDLLGYRLHPGARVRESWLYERTTWLDKRWNSVPLDPAPAPVVRHYAGEPHERRLEALRRDVAALPRAAADTPPVRAPRPRESGPEPLACVLRGDFGGAHSLSVVNDGLADALERRGVEVACAARGAEADARPVTGVSHGWPPEFSPAAAGPAVTILPWEYGAPPAEWVQRIRSGLDRVWVPSRFVRDGYLAAGVPAGLVDVVPNGVDAERFAPGGRALDVGVQAGCTFLFVGGTIWRKGADLLVEAWRRAFGPGDDVALVVKDFGTSTWYRGQGAGEALRALAADPAAAPVRYLDRELAPEDMPALYRAADALVAPYRGEGFCLPVLEAMACGVPALHTAAGPTSEFCPPDAGWALPSQPVLLRAGAAGALEPLAGRGRVDEVDVDALTAALRQVAADAADRAARGKRAREAALAWSWDAAAAAAERSLRDLAGLPLSWLAREHPPAALDAPGAAVAYAPDWQGDRWVETLAEWARVFGPADPVTLFLQPPLADRARLVGAIEARLRDAGLDPETLPDIAIGEVEPRGVHAVLAAADAVLLDGGQREAPSALLARRARRLVAAEPAALRALRAELAL
jgi:glycosyltransferase involved in cell wall biosynthesis